MFPENNEVQGTQEKSSVKDSRESTVIQNQQEQPTKPTTNMTTLRKHQ